MRLALQGSGFILTAAAAVGLWGCEPHASPRFPRANVILVSLDTLRSDHLQVYGYDRDTAPTISRLADESVVFENTLSQAPKTAPSHMTMFTGRYPGAHGVRNLTGDRDQALSGSIPVLAGILARRGYRTVGFTGGGHVGRTLGFDRGFDRFVARGRSIWRARRWIAQWSSEVDPFFLFVHTYSIHDPYVPPAEFQVFNLPDYDGEIIGDRRELVRVAGKTWSAQHSVYWQRVDIDSEADLAQLKALYDAGILATDSRLRGLLEALEAKGLLEATLLIVLSDHGEEFQEHGGFLHKTLYQETLRVPLLMRLPGAAYAGTRVEATARLVDLLPTVLDLVGVEGPDPMQGRSLLPLLDARAKGEPSIVLSEWPGGGARAIQDGRWKLIVGADGTEQLFDLVEDPMESDNVIDSSPVQADRLRRQLAAMTEENRRLLGEESAGEVQELDPEVRAQLEALGYLE